MVLQWFPGGSPVVLQWFSCGSLVVLQWFPSGPSASPVVRQWFPSGSPVVPHQPLTLDVLTQQEDVQLDPRASSTVTTERGTWVGGEAESPPGEAPFSEQSRSEGVK